MRGTRWANGYTRGRLDRLGKKAGKNATGVHSVQYFFAIMSGNAFYCIWRDESKGVYEVLCIEEHTPVLATPWCWWGWCSQVGVRQRWGSGSAGRTQTSWGPLRQMRSRESETDTSWRISNWTKNICTERICELFTCAMSRESGEHSLSMLLVLSLWALEFCLSFMEVLRGRLCSLFSTLLRTRRNTRSSKYMTDKAKKPDRLDLEINEKHSKLHSKKDKNLK